MIRVADFRPAWWLPGPHLQTVWPTLCRHRPRLSLRRERLELPDGDFLDLDWTPGDAGPIIIILHGLEGSSDSGYARGLLAAITARGWRGVVLHFRGCSGDPNRLRHSYSAGTTHDIAYIVDWLRQREPDLPMACAGYSIGGNVLLKWLGEAGDAVPLQAAVAVSVPFLLESAANRMQQGFSRLYQHYLLRNLRASYRRKFRQLADPPVPLREAGKLRDFYGYDDKITAPLHGYAGVYDYYDRASCRRYLAGIATPTLILHAVDDPFMWPSATPTASELSAAIQLELSPYGGHVGFVAGSAPWRARYWLEERIPEFLADHLNGSVQSPL